MSLNVSCPVADRIGRAYKELREPKAWYLGLKETGVNVVEQDPVAGVCGFECAHPCGKAMYGQRVEAGHD